MNEAQILGHLNTEIPPAKTYAAAGEQGLALFDVGKRITEVLKKLVGISGVTEDAAVLAARTFFFAWCTAHNVPMFVANTVWAVLEYSIRELFSQVIEEGAT